MRFFQYGNSGGIDKVIHDMQNPERTFDSLKTALKYISEVSNGAVDVTDLSVRTYAYDDRINHTVYMVSTNRYGNEDFIEQFGHPCFISYLIDLDEHRGEICDMTNP